MNYPKINISIKNISGKYKNWIQNLLQELENTGLYGIDSDNPDVTIDLAAIKNIDNCIKSSIANKKHTLDINLMAITADGEENIFFNRIELMNFLLSPNKKRMLFKIKHAVSQSLKKLEKKPATIYLKIDKTHYNPAKFLYMLFRNFTQKVFNKLFLNDQWFLFFTDRENIEEAPKLIIPPNDRMYADPFIMEKDGKYYVFMEELVFNEGRGFISYFEIDENGNYTPPEPIIKKPYHLSYPFVFRHEDKYYMIPETHENKTVELYEAVDFPGKWEFRKNLLEGLHAIDATIFRHNDKYWMFLNKIYPDCCSNDELHIYYADSVFGEWVPHPKNPVVTDCSRARPAGKVFFRDEEIIRPSQDCSVRYGYAINFNIVEVLNEHEYQEKLIYRKTPEFIDKNLCLHTYNFEGKFKIMDGMRKICFIAVLIFLMITSGINASQAEEMEAKVRKNVYYQNNAFTSREYILGPNDIVDISFMGVPEFNKKSARIQPDGYLTLDLPEPIFAAGITIGELQDLLEEEYAYFVVEPHISINLVETKPFIVYVGGAVMNPGSYELDTNPAKANFSENIKPETIITRRTPLLSNVLVAAGGIKYDADLEHIKITNKFTGKEFEINVLNLLETGNAAQDIYLAAGDSVYVPQLPTAYEISDEKYEKYMSATISPRQVPVRVYGYVNRPGVILLDTQYSLTLNSAITQAGGYLINRAKPPKKIYLSRVDGNGRMVTKTINPTKEDITLRPNDIVYVPEKTRAMVVQLFDDLTRIFTPANVFANSYNNWALMFDKNRFSGVSTGGGSSTTTNFYYNP